MDGKITILAPFFEDPGHEYHIRELSRILKINHTTVRQKLTKLVKEGFLAVIKGKVYSAYKPIFSRKYLNLKLYYNLEKVRISGLIDDIERAFDYPPFILFGSYATGNDDSASDIDICVISNIKKEFETEKYEKNLNRKISLHLFTKDAWKKMAKENKGLLNNICNGIILSGQLEVLT